MKLRPAQLLCASLVLITAVAQADVSAERWQTLLHLAPTGSQIGLRVEPLDAGGTVNIDYQSDLLLPPASTLKLLTAHAAELQLGADFRYQTRLWRRGQQQGNQWQGDWRLEFSGAPDFSRAQLNALLNQIKQQGISRINGDLLLDSAAFDGYDRGNGWPWNNLGVCYSAPASAVILDDNCVAASLTPGEPGSVARFFIPPHQPLEVTNEVVTVTLQQQLETLCELEVDTGPGNHYRLHGCVANNRKIVPLNFAVNDPVAFTRDVIARQLQELGIQWQGQVRGVSNAGTGWQAVMQVESAALSQLLGEMLQDSDNLIADSLLKTLGKQDGGAGNFRNGVRAMTTQLETLLGQRLEPATLADGSGLSRDNLLQASQLAAVLRQLARTPAAVSYQTLAVAGESGTLRYRSTLRNPPLRGNVRAKSGTLNGTSNLAGYITGASGQRYLFVLMVSGISLSDADRRASWRDPLQHPVRAFEKALLEWVYQRG
ncbi:D-alanyl-D-alanine carboxypeptidase/D-alanyl-D-alanine endopeptidase [Marinobacterium rhizophilum]|uniref:D-alanyl-D-alanine carboxypeptidase/D-alanyl-D-alanine-endopeptidase n=1 Tax=Marinobacterium rhizophilum TaxID=420402 RepID=A0ABY5HKY4_9GAMM|nr:D-alanyl-D-alanine carboxypeptidase/D-alanyl-D-alanine-endopeptidase [Marinobacterium rhizophilum]UTW11616.1 D-alanyl-D-alanine carboxypeptidase/D-alanyl-D-alanine-endopeptidase [Marinobacterium rhizophilum]